MATRIPINPEILKWARESLGISISEISHLLKKSEEEIKSWEKGETFPTYSQLEKLAYSFYKRPLAVFFFPNIPEEKKIEEDFRTLPDYIVNTIPRKIHYKIRDAKLFQLNLIELFENKNPAENKILEDIKISLNNLDIKILASKIRSYLNVELSLQKKWKDTKSALEEWRKVFEIFGIFIFKDAFENENFSAFCINHESFPVIYLNNSQPKSRQIFSLFHELFHLLLNVSGIDFREEPFIDQLSGDSQKIEIFCNRFAGEFLVPSVELLKSIKGEKITEQIIIEQSKNFNVSREVILRRLIDLSLFPKIKYNQYKNKWDEEYPISKKSGGNWYYSKISYLGRSYIETALVKYQSNKISANKVTEFLNIKRKNLQKFESYFYK